MSFQKGNKHGRGGKRPGAGAKKQSEIEVKKVVGEIALEYMENHIQPVLKAYVGFAETDPPTARHFIDKVLPEIKTDGSRSGNTYIQFNFGNIEAARPTPEAGFSEERRRSFDGGALYIGGDGGES